jgi:hypothetical protein
MCTSSTSLLCFYRVRYKHESTDNNIKEYKVNQGQRKEVIDVKSRYRRYQNNKEKKRREHRGARHSNTL